MKEKKSIKTNPEACTQCLRCQLYCSFHHTGVFNPLKAWIVIKPGEISFTDECLEKCTLCTLYCVCDAIISQ